MNPFIASLIILVLTITLNVHAKGYRPVQCDSTQPYAGNARYQGEIKLPPQDFILGDAFNATQTQKFEQAMQQAMALTQAPVMSAAVATKDGFWHATKSTDTKNYKMLYWASVGKALTATAIMQLVEDGKLELEDSVSQWLPQLPNAKSITIDHLLLHTSGLFSANEDKKLRRKPRYYTPDEFIEISIRHGAMYCPGEYWRYTNTGYTALGKIIEHLDKRAYHAAINTRIIDRLLLKDLRALAPQEVLKDVAPLIPTDKEALYMTPSWGYAAGNIAGSAEAMLRFWHALLTVKLLSPDNTMRLFEHLYPMFDAYSFYGRGVMLYRLPQESGDAEIWLGHSGGTPGAKALVAYVPHKQAFVAVALNNDGSAEATANLLLQQLQ